MVRFTLLAGLITILISITACKEEKLFYDIEGTITDVISGEPLADLEIVLYQKKYQQNVLNNNYLVVGTATTDQSGRYKFRIDREKIYNIKFEVSHKNYYNAEFTRSQDELKTNTINEFDFTMEAIGSLIIYITNPEVKSGEQLNLYKQGFKEGCETCCSNGNSSFFETGDTTITCAVVGGSTVRIDYGEVLSSSLTSEEITCKRFVPTTYTINY